MFRIAITGGIGSGKTTVCKVFETIGIPVLNADLLAKNIMQTNMGVKHEIQKVFGADTYVNDVLQTKFLAEQVFNNTSLLQQLNEIVHPRVFSYTQSWFTNQNTAYAIYESALIIETNSIYQVDKIIGVQAPVEERIQRIMKRNNCAKEDVEARMAKQLPEAEKEKYYNFTIYNESKQPLIPQVLAVHQSILNHINGEA
jgi:dephospho-CoA kinase